jgi:hypothetical protein
MRKVIVLAVLAQIVGGGLVIAKDARDLSNVPRSPADHSFAGLSYGCPLAWAGPVRPSCAGEISRLLEAINDTGQRAKLAEDWLKFSQQSVMRNWELQKEWLELQKNYLTFQHEIEILRMESLQLQQRINQLQADNLRLQKENMELRLKLQPETAGKEEAK